MSPRRHLAALGLAVTQGSLASCAASDKASTGAAAATSAAAGQDASADVSTPAVLNPGVAPGGNFDLSVWELQEPVGAPGAPTTIPPANLEGPNGFRDSYFFTDPEDGAMTFWDPESGVTTPGSMYPRCELREMTASGAAANWPTQGTHRLSATLRATRIPDHVAVGQIHIGTGTPSSTKPLLELFYYASGAIVLAIEQTPQGGNEIQHTVGSEPLGSRWSYALGLSGETIALTLDAATDGGGAQTFPMPPTFDGENMYFKAGNYDQSVGGSAAIGATVEFYALHVFHGP